MHGGSGHIGRVSAPPDGAGTLRTIEANSGDAWAERTHRVDEPAFLGWLEYPSGGAHPSSGAQEPALEHVQLRARAVVTGLGELDLEDYVALVVAGESPSRRLDALKAVAIAARTYVQQALAADPTLGTAAHPIPNSQRFQVALSPPRPLAVRAAAETRGGVALWKGALILGSHVAGAVWAPGALRGIVSAKYPTERFVTYNEGLVGSAVHPCPSPVADPRNRRNRGCLSQNGADALATRGWRWNGILRYFYGADLEVTLAEPAEPHGPRGAEPEETTSGGSPAVPLVSAALLYSLYRVFA